MIGYTDPEEPGRTLGMILVMGVVIAISVVIALIP